MRKITIIDYGCGNILNLVRAIKFLGYKIEVTSDKEKIIKSSHVIFPGVGAFGNAMQLLKKYDLPKIIIEYTNLKKPILGICLGMQLLLTKSEEFGIHSGLDLIEGNVIKIPSDKNNIIKIPHTGWNEIYRSDNKKIWQNKILKNILVGTNFYFVHSFIGLTKDINSTSAFCNYSGINIPAVISKNNIFGCQFHPEKSGENGLTILKNFCEI